MEISKPKKALRGLFTRTEPASEVEATKQEIKVAENHPTKTIEKLELQQEHSAPLIEDTLSGSTKIENKVSTFSSQVVLEKEKPNALGQPQSAEYSITKIQYNFERLKLERNKWDKSEYINFIHRIDNAQTEAFFLKGKLIGEIKERFYEGNKTGWRNFCEENLNMNYTTANQYIRVAEEFDSVTTTRTDFGFEHFKALLPVPSEKRKGILESVPSSVSVKTLRNIISHTLGTNEDKGNSIPNKTNFRQISENLEKMKLQLENLNLDSLEQSEKWSLLGAFQNLTSEMTKISEILSKSHENKYSTLKQIGAISALHEDNYVS